MSIEELLTKVLENSESEIIANISCLGARVYATQKNNEDGDEVCAAGKDLRTALENILIFWGIEKNEEAQEKETPTDSGSQDSTAKEAE